MSEPSLTKCHDCDASPGEQHRPNCDVERCSVCGGQRLTCENYVACAAHDPSKTVWSGEWPGMAECRERGWFCQDGFGPNSRWGSFRPCLPDAPGAMHDINRLAFFKRTGADTLYAGWVPDTKP